MYNPEFSWVLSEHHQDFQTRISELKLSICKGISKEMFQGLWRAKLLFAVVSQPPPRRIFLCYWKTFSSRHGPGMSAEVSP